MHVLPRVGELHERFQDVLEVVGVHAGKFITERITERIADACVRLGVRHPVVNDRQYRVWREYGVRAWPTVALIDPEGYLVGVHSGEFSVEPMARTIEELVARHEQRGTLRRGRTPSLEATPHEAPGTLRFPTRAIVSDDALWISDSGNGRVLECTWHPVAPAAEVRREYAGFSEPRGLAVVDGAVYVADRRGQSIWRLSDGEKDRVAGTGVLSDYSVEEGSAATPLRSPWGLAAFGSQIAVAMAGSHQLWGLDPDAATLSLLAGRGGEDIADGEARAALLAQPTGLSANDWVLAFADCETSAVRTLGGGVVSTLVGTDLFEFGDKPGAGDEARQQHCEDVAWHRGALALADTYNDRLKRLEPDVRRIEPWPGEAGEQGALREPGGVFSDGEVLLIADTGRHRLVTVDEDGALTEVYVT